MTAHNTIPCPRCNARIVRPGLDDDCLFCGADVSNVGPRIPPTMLASPDRIVIPACERNYIRTDEEVRAELVGRAKEKEREAPRILAPGERVDCGPGPSTSGRMSSTLDRGALTDPGGEGRPWKIEAPAREPEPTDFAVGDQVYCKQLALVGKVEGWAGDHTVVRFAGEDFVRRVQPGLLTKVEAGLYGDGDRHAPDQWAPREARVLDEWVPGVPPSFRVIAPPGGGHTEVTLPPGPYSGRITEVSWDPDREISGTVEIVHPQREGLDREQAAGRADRRNRYVAWDEVLASARNLQGVFLPYGEKPADFAPSLFRFGKPGLLAAFLYKLPNNLHFKAIPSDWYERFGLHYSTHVGVMAIDSTWEPPAETEFERSARANVRPPEPTPTPTPTPPAPPTPPTTEGVIPYDEIRAVCERAWVRGAGVRLTNFPSGTMITSRRHLLFHFEKPADAVGFCIHVENRPYWHAVMADEDLVFCEYTGAMHPDANGHGGEPTTHKPPSADRRIP